MAPPILSLPAEVHTEIFSHLDINSVLALRSTCKYLKATLKNNQKAIAKRVVKDIILEETGHTSDATVKLAFMVVEAQRIMKDRDIDTLLDFHASFQGVAADQKDWIKLACRIPELIQDIYNLVIPNLVCFPLENSTMGLSFDEKGRMIRGILAIETIVNLVKCVQGHTHVIWSHSILLASEFFLKFSRHEAKQMGGILRGLLSIRDASRTQMIYIPSISIRLAPLGRFIKTLLCILPETPATVVVTVQDALYNCHQQASISQPHRSFPAFAPGVPRSAAASRDIFVMYYHIQDKYDPFLWTTRGRNTIVHILDNDRYKSIVEMRPAWTAWRGYYLGNNNIFHFRYVTSAVEKSVLEMFGGAQRLAMLLPLIETRLARRLGYQ
ncbi:hypothetical protein F4810DRAFT_716158 [Camillea tinctor]|nr:hypothetical protein F4810DRAFT_716158 [Camillea tinctor]